jgi:hypothetical protein
MWLFLLKLNCYKDADERETGEIEEPAIGSSAGIVKADTMWYFMLFFPYC